MKKNAAAVAMGKLRWKKVSKAQRIKAARHAALVRWRKEAERKAVSSTG
jgi:hypothetical protein